MQRDVDTLCVRGRTEGGLLGQHSEQRPQNFLQKLGDAVDDGVFPGTGALLQGRATFSRVWGKEYG